MEGIVQFLVPWEWVLFNSRENNFLIHRFIVPNFLALHNYMHTLFMGIICIKTSHDLPLTNGENLSYAAVVWGWCWWVYIYALCMWNCELYR